MGHKLLGMTLLAVFHCFRRVHEGIFDVLLLLPHDITPCPTFAQCRLERHASGEDRGQNSCQRYS